MLFVINGKRKFLCEIVLYRYARCVAVRGGWGYVGSLYVVINYARVLFVVINYAIL